MITKLPIADPGSARGFAEAGSRLPIEVGAVSSCRGGVGGSVGGTPDVVPYRIDGTSHVVRYKKRGGFSMVELLVAMTLLSLIVFALMAVFSSTQQAFRSSVTQTDILEGSRMAMQMMTDDLHGMVPSDQVSNYVVQPPNFYYGAVNFSTATNMYPYTPLKQPLLGSTGDRVNYLQYFFVLGRVNLKWTAVGYAVNATSPSPLYPLYRYYAEAPITASPIALYWNFTNMIYYSQWTNMSHVMDGVVHLVVRAYDMNGYEMTNTVHYYNSRNQAIAYQNVNFLPVYSMLPDPLGEANFVFFSNAVPAAVELQLGVLEDRALQRAESLGNGLVPSAVNDLAQWQYLQNQAGHVHLFRQRVTIPNVDPGAYQ